MEFHGTESDQNQDTYLQKKTAPLKKALKQGWILSSQCEVFFEPKNNHWYVRVFVSRPPLRPPQPQLKSIGIDVGINHIVTTSEGFLGNSLKKRLKKLNNSKREKQRQLSLAKNKGLFTPIFNKYSLIIHKN